MPSQYTVTEPHIKSLLDSAQSEEHIFWGKEMVISYLLPNGFSVLGRSACVDPANFDIELGRKYAREDAEDQLWRLEGYLIQQKMYQERGFSLPAISEQPSC